MNEYEEKLRIAQKQVQNLKSKEKLCRVETPAKMDAKTTTIKVTH